MGFMKFKLDKKKAKKNKGKKLAKKLGCKVCPLFKRKTELGAHSDYLDSSILILIPSMNKANLESGFITLDDHRYLKTNIEDLDLQLFYPSILPLHQCYSNKKENDFIIDCCRDQKEKSIEKMDPKLIIGIGEECLNWIGKSNIHKWRGKIIPVTIGNLDYWFAPILDPKYILSKRNKKYPQYPTQYDNVFKMDLLSIKEFIFSTEFKQAKVIKSGYEKNIKIITGENTNDFIDLKYELEKLEKEKKVAIDIEATGLNPYAEDAKLLSVSIGTYKNTISFPIEYPGAWKGKQNKVKKLLKEFILGSGVKIAHNLKFELKWFLHYFGADILYKTKWADTMAQAYVIDVRKEAGAKSLDGLVDQYFGFNLKSLSNINVKNLEKEDLKDVLMYNALDTKYTYLLFEAQEKVLKSRPKSPKLLKHLNETAITIAQMEAKGIDVDIKVLDKFSEKFNKEIKRIEKKFYNLKEVKAVEKIIKKKFNLSASADHTVRLFRDIYKLEKLKETKKAKKFSVDESVLKKYARKGNEAAKILLLRRKADKLRSTYIDKLYPLLTNENKIKAQFTHLVTETGRTSSKEPNMQNYPSRVHKDIRNIFIAPKGSWFVSIDYGQIEARVLAMVSGETNIVEQDVHMYWAIKILKAYPLVIGFNKFKDISKKALKMFRKRTKNEWVFPLFYKAGNWTVNQHLNLPDNILKKLIKEFWDYFPKVKIWQDKIVQQYEENYFVYNQLDRRRYAPIKLAEYINHPIQSTASDIVVAAMNRITKKAYKENKEYLIPILNIHDDLSFILPDDKLEEALDEIIDEMLIPPEYAKGIKLSVEVSIGNSWGNLEEMFTREG